MQAWGEHSAFAHRDTVRFPTRSGLIGLLASAEGRPRDATLDRYTPLAFTVRVDRAGVAMEDFHTVGGGYPRHRTVITAEGKRRSADTATIVSRRRYLADAVFCVAITGPPDLTAPIADALRRPRWQPYLGRRSCPPEQPLLLAAVDNPIGDLQERVPVARFPPRDAGEHTEVEFVTDDIPVQASTVTELADVPLSFTPMDRRYQTRAVTTDLRGIPTSLFHGRTRDYLTALHAYTQEA
jgi:CRISPR system Cascade subunit CasD